MDLHLIVPVIMISVLLTPGFSITTNENALQQDLETALTENPRNLDELTGKFPTDNLSPVTCVTVQYTIQCRYSQCPNEGYSDTVSDFNCTSPSGYTASFLWTVFPTTRFPGNVLLFWLVGGLRVLGFEWDDSCKFRLNDTEDTVMLLLDFIGFPCINDAEGATEKALKSMTLRLKSYTENGNANRGNSMSSYSQYRKSGNAMRWQRHDITTHQRGILGIRIGLAIFCILFTVLFAPKLLSAIYEKLGQKHVFWSFIILASVWSWIGLEVTGFIGALKEDTYIYGPIFYGVNGVYVVLGISTQCCNCNVKWCKKWFKLSTVTYSKPERCLEAIVNIFVLQSIFCLILAYLLYFLPSIVLSYYAFPSRTLFRLAYFELALIILLATVTLLLYVVEDCYKQWRFKQRCSKESEVGTTAATDSGASTNGSAKKEVIMIPLQSEYETSTSGRGACEYKSLNHEESEQTPQDHVTQTPVTNDTSCNCEKLYAILKVITVFLFLAITSFVLAIAGGIVFIATSDGSEASFLIIVPTILTNVAIISLSRRRKSKIPEPLDKEYIETSGKMVYRLGTFNYIVVYCTLCCYYYVL